MEFLITEKVNGIIHLHVLYSTWLLLETTWLHTIGIFIYVINVYICIGTFGYLQNYHARPQYEKETLDLCFFIRHPFRYWTDGDAYLRPCPNHEAFFDSQRSVLNVACIRTISGNRVTLKQIYSKNVYLKITKTWLLRLT
jgi:hypothetical protein